MHACNESANWLLSPPYNDYAAHDTKPYPTMYIVSFYFTTQVSLPLSIALFTPTARKSPSRKNIIIEKQTNSIFFTYNNYIQVQVMFLKSFKI